MIVEITGTSTRNKGAELMLVAIAEHLRECVPDATLVVTTGFGTYAERASYGLSSKLASTKLGRISMLTAIMPAALRRAYGMVTEPEIDVVIDASGFAFSDQLGARRVEQFATDVRRWKNQGKRVVLLPQALGPFETDRVRNAFNDILDRADLVFARDKVSYQHLQHLQPNHQNVRLAPDFTNLVTGEIPPGYEPQPRHACIVPNHRMVEKTTSREQAEYIPFLTKCIAELCKRDIAPLLLLHDTHTDEELVQPIQSAIATPIPVLRESNPRRLKGILGAAHVVVGSRFHALVGALSQAVPCIGAGWSHKYQMLFEDYDCPECLLSTDTPCDEIGVLVKQIANGSGRDKLVERLTAAGKEQVRSVHKMWAEVDTLLGLESGELGKPRPSMSVNGESCAVPV